MRAAALLAVLASCTSQVIWSGHTDDRRRRIDIVLDGDHTFVVIDGKRTAGFAAVAAGSLALAGRHVAFAARHGAGWVVVGDGRQSALWDGVGAIELTATGRLAYSAERAGGWAVVVDGAAGPRFDAILAGSLRFSADATRLAYAAGSAGAVRTVVDGQPGAPWQGIPQLGFSPDAHHAGYVGRRGRDYHAVIDGAAGPAWSAIGALVLGPANHVAYAASDGAAWRVVADGEPGPAVAEVRRIAWRDDGRHLAWLAVSDGASVLALDGTPVAAAPHLRDAGFAFRPGATAGDAPGLAYISVAATGERMIVDGVAGPLFDEIGAPVWSASGKLAYAARRGRAWVVIGDGRELPGGGAVGTPVWSATDRLGYVARRGRTTVAVVDGRVFAFDLAFEDSLAFSRDGSHWAVAAGALATEHLFFAIDGTRRIPIDAVELYATGGREDTLRRWTQAEADRAAESAEAAAGAR